MEIKNIKIVCFSPTGTTAKLLLNIAKGITAKRPAVIDLTLPGAADQPIRVLPDETVLFGAPVYAGRLPVQAVQRFRQIRAENAMAVLVVNYGNREFDDALLELKNLVVSLGFAPLAAAAFISEHSYSTRALPIAAGRPDDTDLSSATAFGQQIRALLAARQPYAPLPDLKVPGHFPYAAPGTQAGGAAPVTHPDLCALCGECVAVCPTGAIRQGSTITTHTEDCIRCCACVKACPSEARSVEDGSWLALAQKLHANLGLRKEPRIFWP